MYIYIYVGIYRYVYAQPLAQAIRSMAYVALRATLGEIDAIVVWTLVRVGPEALRIIESFLGRSVRDTIFRLLSWPEWNNGFALWECLESESPCYLESESCAAAGEGDP